MIPLLGIFLASLKIRAYQPADENAVLALCTRCGLVSPDSNSLADIHRKLAVQPELFLVGTLDSAIIAFGMAGYDGHRGYLYYLAVSPEHQRRGYGRAVVTHVQGLLRERGCSKLNLFVSTDNFSAFAFYERLGFTRNDMVSMGRHLTHETESA
jgi:ribosomal protein S18 acetylase RimI-like enzyme